MLTERSPALVTQDAVFAGSVPDFYDRMMVPLIFEPYAQDIARRAARVRPRSILEIAAGTGVVTRALAAALPDTRIVSTDLNEPMLAFAKTRQPHSERVEWKQADASALPFDEQTFDVVVCQFGAMFFPDKVQAYREARRVLNDGGLFLFSVWDRISENDFADVVTQCLAGVFPADPPCFLARTPHGYHDTRRIAAELADAGFADVTIEAVGATSKAGSARDPAIAYCQGTPLRMEIVARDAEGLERATDVAAAALAERFGEAPISGRIHAFVVTAKR